MLKTIDRYVIREVVPPFFLSLLIFTFILEIPPVMRHLETLVAKGVGWQVAGQMLLTLLPQALGITIPMALLTGILIGLGRLSSDREAVALLACGVSPYRLLRPILFLALVAAAATLYVMIKAIPDANQTFNGSPTTSSPSGSRTTSGRACSSRISQAGFCITATNRTGGRLEGRPGGRYDEAGKYQPVPGVQRTPVPRARHAAGRPGPHERNPLFVRQSRGDRRVPLPG